MAKENEKNEPRFLGVHSATIDGKRRINIPSAYRKEDVRLYDKFSMFADPTRPALVLYDSDKPPFRKDSKLDMEIVSAFIIAAQLDASGRVLIPKEMAGMARLPEIGDKVIIAGAGSYFEIWDPLQWELELRRRIEMFSNPSADR